MRWDGVSWWGCGGCTRSGTREPESAFVEGAGRRAQPAASTGIPSQQVPGLAPERFAQSGVKRTALARPFLSTAGWRA